MSILGVGRLLKLKNFKFLLDAFAEIDKDVKLYILGEGPERQNLERIVSELGIESRVIFKGFVKNPFNWMHRSDVFVLSSDYEGMPGVLIQAMYCGAACVATDCETGPSELIKNGENGFLIEPRDKDVLVSRLNQLLDKKGLKNQFKINSRKSLVRFREKEAVRSYFEFLN